MREIRLSGSEGGGTEFNQLSLPLSKALRAGSIDAGSNTGYPALAARMIRSTSPPGAQKAEISFPSAAAGRAHSIMFWS